LRWLQSGQVRFNALFFLCSECKIQMNHLIWYGEVVLEHTWHVVMFNLCGDCFSCVANPTKFLKFVTIFFKMLKNGGLSRNVKMDWSLKNAAIIQTFSEQLAKNGTN
jgi:hypothetical protein